MARLALATIVLEAAARWRDDCLLGGGSIFTNQPLWTRENAEALEKHYSQNLDLGEGDFFQKFEGQLADAPVAAIRLAAEILWVIYLIVSSEASSGATKRRQIREVFSWSGDDIPENHWALGSVLEEGVAHPGTAYQTHRWRELVFFIAFLRRWAELRAEGRTALLSDPWAFSEWLDTVEGASNRQLPHVLCFLLFPDSFERIASRGHKERIVAAFAKHLSDPSAAEYRSRTELDKAIFHVREAMSEEYGDDLDFYNEAIRSQWRKSKDTDKETVGKPPISSGKQFWIEKTIVRGRPDRQSGEYAVGRALWSPTTDKRGADTYRFMRDVRPGDVILHLTDNEAFTGVSVAEAPYEELDGPVVTGTQWGEGSCYLVRLDDYRELAPPLDRNTLFGEPFATRLNQLAGSGQGKSSQRGSGTRNRGVKNLFYNRYRGLNQGAYLTPAPVALLNILDDAYKSVSGGRTLTGEEAVPPVKEPNPEYSLAQCAEETGLRKDLLERWVRAVDRKGQAIFYGPPGTGKTFIAEKLATHLTGGNDGIVELVQFHPSDGYEDFIQGIRPSTESGELRYKVLPGRFLEFCEAASMRPGSRCVLIVDEINRANLSRVFGELMYLLEYRTREVPLAGGGSLSIPKNVRMIGTMNTADRSIALVDHALRRRFAFLSLQPEYEILRRYHEREKTGFDPDSLIDVLRQVNRQVNDRHYEVGITFFLRRHLEDQIEDIWRMEIEPYLEEYFFDQAEKVADFRWDKVGQRISG